MYLGQSSSNSPAPCVGKFQVSDTFADRVWAYEFRIKHPEGPGPNTSWSGPYAHETDWGEIYDSFYYIPKDILRQLIDQALALPHSDYHPIHPGPISVATWSTLGREMECGQVAVFTPAQAQSWFQTIGLPPGGPEARSPAPPPAGAGPSPMSAPGIAGAPGMGLGTIALLGLGAWLFYRS